MATITGISGVHYKTYQGQAASPYYKERAADPHYMGYSYNNTTNTSKYCSCFTIQLPTFDGVVSSVKFNLSCIRGGSTNINAGKTYKIGLANDANNAYPTGDYTTYGSYTGTISNSTTISTSEVVISKTFNNYDMGSSPLSGYLTTGKKIYVFLYSGAQEANWLQVSSLSVDITYTPTTYYAKVNTNSNSNATSSVSPSSGIKGASVKFSASSSGNTTSYIYSDLKLYVSNSAGGSTLVASKNGHAQDLGGKLSTSYSTTFSSDVWYYAKATATSALPGSVSCSATKITSTTARISIPDGITTTFIDDNYYISSLSNSYYAAANFTKKASGVRSNKYVDLTGLESNKSQTWYVFTYNGCNGYYYKIGSVNFTTDASSYSITASASNISSNSAIISITSGPNPTTNLNNYWYLSTSTDNDLTSLENVTSALRTETISLSNLESQATITRNIYVYSTASGKYYKAGSISFETTVAQYNASLIVTGITESQADITLFGLSDTTNLDDKYYLSETNSGLSTNSLSIHSSENRGTTIRVSNLIPGHKYNFYCYLYNTYDAKYYYVGNVNFVTYSTIVYFKTDIKDEVQKSRLYIYDPILGAPRGLILKPVTHSKKNINNLLPGICYNYDNPNIVGNTVASCSNEYYLNGNASLKMVSANATAPENLYTINYNLNSGFSSTIPLDNTHLYYFRAWIYQTEKVGTFGVYWPIAEPNFTEGNPVSAPNTWTKVSLINHRNNFTNGNYNLRFDFNNSGKEGIMYIANPMLIDLTACYGKGNEPDKTWCDEHIPYIYNSI